MLKRERALEYHGEYYDIPIKGGTGLGKPLKLIIHPLRKEIPIYIAAIGPKNVALAGEIADKIALAMKPLERARMTFLLLSSLTTNVPAMEPTIEIAPISNGRTIICSTAAGANVL